MKTILIFVLAMAMVCTMLVFASCGEEEEKPAEDTETLTIGLSAPLSGAGAGYGGDIKAGMDMAIEKINDDGGITVGDTTYNFAVEAKDDEMVPEQALTNATSMVLEEGVNIIFDPTANTIQSLMTINETAGEEFLIMAYTSTPLNFTEVNPNTNTMYVSGPPPFTAYIEEFIKLAMGNGWIKLGMLQTTGAYGELWGDTFSQYWAGAGGEIVASSPADYYTTTDYTANLTTVLEANPDVLFIGGPSDPTALVIEQARGLGFEGGFIVIDQAKLDDIAQITGMEALEGAIGVLPPENAVADFPYMEQFAADYEAEYNDMVTWETAITYTMFNILAKAIEEAGVVDDVEAIRAAFAEGNVSVTSGDEFPVAFSGIESTIGALLMPATTTMVVDGDWADLEMQLWWEE